VAAGKVVLGRVAEIWRYPVKSMQGGRLAAARVTDKGLDGDRRWALRDVVSGRLISAKQNRHILDASAQLDGDRLTVTLPDGRQLSAGDAGVDGALSGWLGREVNLEHAGPESSGVYEFFVDPEDETSEAIEFNTPDGTFMDAATIHILTTGSLRSMTATHPGHEWDLRRFRPGLLVEVDGGAPVEDQWVGSTLRIGTAEVNVVMQTIRCGMPGRGQPGLEPDGEVVRILKQDRNALLGVYAAVEVAGEISEGDPVLA
jgi:uncharacterized protein YcbX